MKNEKKKIRMEVNDEGTSAMEFVKAWHLAQTPKLKPVSTQEYLKIAKSAFKKHKNAMDKLK